MLNYECHFFYKHYHCLDKISFTTLFQIKYLYDLTHCSRAGPELTGFYFDQQSSKRVLKKQHHMNAQNLSWKNFDINEVKKLTIEEQKLKYVVLTQHVC